MPCGSTCCSCAGGVAATGGPGILERDGDNLIQPATRVYFRDVYDHSLRIIENLETYRETVSG